MADRGARGKLRIGVAKLASCDGCQLTLLDLETELLSIAERVDIVEFPEASSLRSSGPYDVLFVEGSVSTPDQAAEIVELRRQAKTLVTIGACATAGGIQALRNWSDHEVFRTAVYPQPGLVESLATATPISEHVTVDAALGGCPISPEQLRELVAALLAGRRPQVREEAVCLECKRRGYVCVMVATGTPCLGPLTQTGCGALCPAFGRGCYGCFGPREQPHTASLARTFAGRVEAPSDVARLFAGFTGWSPPFRGIVGEYGGPPGMAPVAVAGGADGSGGSGTGSGGSAGSGPSGADGRGATEGANDAR
jgi:coenzyme F420-reducing hydrogenase gamma subunit